MTSRRAARARVPAEALPPGIYELPVTMPLAERVAASEALAQFLRFAPLKEHDAAYYLARHVAEVVERVLRDSRFGDDVAAQIRLCNNLIAHLESHEDRIARPHLLTEVRRPASGLSAPGEIRRPTVAISQSALFVNGPHDPVLSAELQREIASADRIDLICAFVVWSGVRVLFEALEEAQARGVPLRVLTTTYGGVTQARALDALIERGAAVKVSYEQGSTRLHAKGWLFERASGFSSAYIGSSNLSHTALHDGREWNVRLSAVENARLIERFRATFESYWDDPHFVPYERATFVKAIDAVTKESESGIPLVDVHPYPFQEQILERLAGERERHARRRNLVVAATGTGKTMIAAFDFARLRRERPNARLLFVAHRHEILAQSRRLFGLVLRSPHFGGLLVAGERPTDDRHVFASIQSLSQIDLSAELAPEHYDVVIVDEFHHAEAPTYQRLLDHLRPWTLLGLTATPERSDGQDILHWFDGRIAAELRLWDALEQGHLCPFQYFGVGDNVDLVGVQWRRGGYAVAEIDNLYTGNDRRVQTILLAIERLIRDPEHMRALGFCVSVAHADFMAKRFSEKGIAATAVTGSTPPEERSVALERLRNGQIQVIFSVDVLNEGLDIPDIDTVLFLRPTESATVFLQQLGRGLRKASGKSGLTVLDFVGRQHAQFRFEPRFAALTNTTGRRLERAIEHDFPFLPSGCAIHLDPVAREIVLTNVKRSIAARSFNALASDLKRHGDISLRAFLSAEEIALDDIYRSKAGWSRLREQAGFIGDLGPSGSGLANAVGRMRHIHDSLRLETYRRWLVEPHPPRVDRLGKADRRLLHMLVASLYGSQPFADEAAALAHLWPHEAIRRELCDLFDVLDDQSELLDVPYDDPEVPLCVHGTYSRPEILAAFGDWRVAKPPSVREGVRYLAESASDLFWITLNKDPERYIPSTMYRDYPISRELFHWESQSTTTSRSATGQRYIHHVERGSRVCLFVRTEPENAAGIAFAFTFLGTARYVSHHGDRPMKITWRLDRPMPADLFVAGRAVA